MAEADVIDISWMDPEQLRVHLRRTSELTSCPCMRCTSVCDSLSTVENCDAYQLWYWQMIQKREKRKR